MEFGFGGVLVHLTEGTLSISMIFFQRGANAWTNMQGNGKGTGRSAKEEGLSLHASESRQPIGVIEFLLCFPSAPPPKKSLIAKNNVHL